MEAALEGPAREPIADRRLRRRAAPEPIDCDRGVVVDISIGGLRLQSRRLLTGDVDLVFSREGDNSLDARARVVWSQRVGMGKYLSGLEFLDLKADSAREFLQIA